MADFFSLKWIIDKYNTKYLFMKRVFRKLVKPSTVTTKINRSNVIKGKPRVMRNIKPQQTPMGKPLPINYLSSLPVKSSNKVFIVGGGPSAKDVDFKALQRQGHDIICVNKAIEYVSYAKFFITMDYTFFQKTNLSLDNINARVDQSIFILNKQYSNIKEVNGIVTDTRHNFQYTDLNKLSGVIVSTKETNPGFGKDLASFAHGSNSGYCALQLAILMKYEEIHLIGFDLMTIGNTTHFHSGYNQNNQRFQTHLQKYKNRIISDIRSYDNDNIFVSTKSTALKTLVKYKSLTEVFKEEVKPLNVDKSLNDLVVVAYYTVNTPYEAEANKLIASLKKLGINHDVVGVKNLGNWQANTRFKAKFMESMLNKHVGKNLLYVDSDAIVHSSPILFQNYQCDIAVRWQDFRWRQNECLSGTIFMANNDKTRELCRRWQHINTNEGPNATTFEQWNLGKVIQDMRREGKIKDKNLPPEYTFIFDIMRKMYPNIKPVIEHFQASRRLKNKVNNK